MTDALALARAPFAEVTVGADRVTVLKDGEQTFPAMFEALRLATSTLCIETYILVDDSLGQKLAEVLIERAYAGVEVNLMYDGWGANVSDAYVMRLRLAGVRTLCFQPVSFFGRFGRFNRAVARLKRRDHRKSIIVDGRVAFTGGLTLSNDYASVADGGNGWRDTHVRVEGPAAVQLERMFLSNWRQHRGPAIDETRYKRPAAAPGGHVRFIGNDFATDRKDIRTAYTRAFNQAKKSIRITNSYFMPPNRMLKGLMKAAKHGVEVSIIIAGATDVPLVLLATRGLYGKLLRSGVHIYEWKGRVLHAKTATVDGTWSTIGSANLDALSLRQNLEVNAVFDDAGVARAVENLFDDDLRHCEHITRETLLQRWWIERVLSWLAYRVRSWL
jgi:cardiolipin synthase